MKNFALTIAMACLASLSVYGQAGEWKIAGDRIKTPWADNVAPQHPLPEYPRPQMAREQWTNLNGLWDMAIVPVGQVDMPKAWDGKILVPYPVESALSGVGKTVGKDNVLWYKKQFELPTSHKGKNTLLHFGAVDWRCEVFINGKKALVHEGGYDPFTVDMTPHLVKGDKQEVALRVWDPSDEGPQPRGKQVKTPKSIWYTPVTGIWQTVWIEPVPASHIESIKIVPDLDHKTLQVSAMAKMFMPGDMLKVSAWDGGNKVAELENSSPSVLLTFNTVKPWSPDSPFLYDLRVSIVRKGKVVDEVKGYAGMRKISMGVDDQGIKRMLLNNQFVFQFGPLDQGWWPDGLYTAPTDEALKFDIEKTKAMGFNMIRKHVKVEPARWYYHCDRLGMLVWQDMPSGDMGNRWDSRPGIIGQATDKNRTEESEKIFKTEWKAIIESRINSPAIVVWVPFNEAWGQFKTSEIVQYTAGIDPTRLINSASGGNFHPTGHILDVHNYPEPIMPDPALFGKDQIIVLGEYGGLGLPIDGHTWQGKDNWGYQSFKNRDELWQKYASFIERLKPLIEKGLSAAVYTQTTDVEIEVNGLMTYDRKEIKMDVQRLSDIHRALYDPALARIKK